MGSQHASQHVVQGSRQHRHFQTTAVGWEGVGVAGWESNTIWPLTDFSFYQDMNHQGADFRHQSPFKQGELCTRKVPPTANKTT